jgi:diguanylate cyclase
MAAVAATLAKGALRRLAQAQLEPTPENYARAYAEEAGQAAPPASAIEGRAWAALIEKLTRQIERSSRTWTAARKKDGLQRVLDGSRSDAQRLLQRLQSLVNAWGDDMPQAETETAAPPSAHLPAPLSAPAAEDWPPLVALLQHTVAAALPSVEPRAAELADQLAALGAQVGAQGVSPGLLAEIDAVCSQARRLFAHRDHRIEQLGSLCRDLTLGLAELSEDDSWARGQCEALQARLDQGFSARSVRAAGQLLAETRQRQRQLQSERTAARDALKTLIQRMLGELGELDKTTGRFERAVGQHVKAVAHADTLESLAGVVKNLLDESQAVQSAVGQARERLNAEHSRATELQDRVRELESELRRLSDEVSTDALTQVANRRGLAQAFEAESARALRGDAADPGLAGLAIGLIDIDNFKKLNDTLGHAVGDTALKSLAAAVRERLRPVDHLARFGGEEFVVLLPATEIGEAQQALTRLQRALTASLFMHDGHEVFVTFSAGVTAWRPGEALETALERADEALYEAKRSGKNRTCLG